MNAPERNFPPGPLGEHRHGVVSTDAFQNKNLKHGARRIAVVGAGIAGLSAAWLLSRQGEAVVLFEAEPRLGGHSHTVDVSVDGLVHPVDTGFLVFNEKTYPNLIGLFDHLGVDSVKSEMSFSVSLQDPDLEWAGSNLMTVFGQGRNLIRPGYWRMLSDILRFNRETTEWLDAGKPGRGMVLSQFLSQGAYSDEFTHWYLLPMAAAIWSCPTSQMLDYPLETFLRFCRNHGLLQILDRPNWRTVQGGSREYVKRMAAGIHRTLPGVAVRSVIRGEDQVAVCSTQGVDLFDEVIFATHADQTLRILGDGASAEEKRILRTVPYQRNRAVLHTDPALLPRNPRMWSAWNYLSAGNDTNKAVQRPVAVSYLINRLQPLPFEKPVVVTLNPLFEPAPQHVIAEFDYEHPVFDAKGIEAQEQLSRIQGKDHSWFAGAWTGYGFHEDGLKSGMAVALALGAEAPWVSKIDTEAEVSSERALA